MNILKHALSCIALILVSSVATHAQTFTYSSIRKDYVFSDGFGIPHSKTIMQSGSVRINRNEVYIDGVMYRMDSEGVYKDVKGKSVDLSYSYTGKKLVAVRISTGHIINNYLLDKASQVAVVQN